MCRSSLCHKKFLKIMDVLFLSLLAFQIQPHTILSSTKIVGAFFETETSQSTYINGNEKDQRSWIPLLNTDKKLQFFFLHQNSVRINCAFQDGFVSFLGASKNWVIWLILLGKSTANVPSEHNIAEHCCNHSRNLLSILSCSMILTNNKRNIMATQF